MVTDLNKIDRLQSRLDQMDTEMCLILQLIEKSSKTINLQIQR